jgi:hypothetical protein
MSVRPFLSQLSATENILQNERLRKGKTCRVNASGADMCAAFCREIVAVGSCT